ncbi:MAG: hypothetical protein ACXABY_17900 [Candidatus Thorarchaeota archaeon]|jgi:hypothetical protein
MTEHKDSCSEVKYADEYAQDLKEWKLDLATYIKQWPDYCKECNGWGGQTSTYDPSPAGISLSPGYMTDYDPCGECVEKDICPRCAEKSVKLIEHDEKGDHYACLECKWVEQEDEGCPLDPPDSPECDCWEDAR